MLAEDYGKDVRFQAKGLWVCQAAEQLSFPTGCDWKVPPWSKRFHVDRIE
jgi:hypothetical protein